MPQSLSKITLHLVFSTKNHERWIDTKIRSGLHAYLAGACRAVGSQAYRVGGTDDHIHIACTLPRTLTVSKLLEEIKLTGRVPATGSAAEVTASGNDVSKMSDEELDKLAETL